MFASRNQQHFPPNGTRSQTRLLAGSLLGLVGNQGPKSPGKPLSRGGGERWWLEGLEVAQEFRCGSVQPLDGSANMSPAWFFRCLQEAGRGAGRGLGSGPLGSRALGAEGSGRCIWGCKGKAGR